MVNLAARRIKSSALSFENQSAVEIDHRLLRIENLEDLGFISFRICAICFRDKRRARGRAPGRIANHSGEVANQEDDRVAQILKVFELAEKHRVSEVQVRRSRVNAQLYAQRFAGGAGFFQLRASSHSLMISALPFLM